MIGSVNPGRYVSVGGFREKKISLAILILAFPSVLSLILFIVNQGRF